MTSLCLVLLKTTSEELACPREDLSVARKDELRKLLLEQMPSVLGLLTGEDGSLVFGGRCWIAIEVCVCHFYWGSSYSILIITLQNVSLTKQDYLQWLCHSDL